MLDQRLHQVIRCVVGAGRGSFITTGKGKLNRTVGADKDRFVFQQTLVDRTKLLNIEGSIVDPDHLTVIRVLIQAQGSKAVQQGLIIKGTTTKKADGIKPEQVTRQWCDTELAARAAILKNVLANGRPALKKGNDEFIASTPMGKIRHWRFRIQSGL